LLGHLAVAVNRLHQIFRHAPSVGVAPSQCIGVVLIGSLAEPAFCLSQVLYHAKAIVIALTKVRLRGRVTVLGSLAVPIQGNLEIPTRTAAVLKALSDLVLGSGVLLLGSLAEPLQSSETFSVAVAVTFFVAVAVTFFVILVSVSVLFVSVSVSAVLLLVLSVVLFVRNCPDFTFVDTAQPILRLDKTEFGQLPQFQLVRRTLRLCRLCGQHLEQRPAEVSTRESNARELGTGELGTRELGTGEIGTREVGVREISA